MSLYRKWKTKDGMKLFIKDMTTNHIKNCINVCNKLHKKILINMYEFSAICNGEMAEEWIENDIAKMEDDQFCQCRGCSYKKSFNNELIKREKHGK